MPKPVCMKCNLFYRPLKNGIFWTEGMPRNDGWKPYKVWQSDAWECRACGSQIIIGHGIEPLAVQHEREFEQIRQQTEADKINVNDC